MDKISFNTRLYIWLALKYYKIDYQKYKTCLVQFDLQVSYYYCKKLQKS